MTTKRVAKALGAVLLAAAAPAGALGQGAGSGPSQGTAALEALTDLSRVPGPEWSGAGVRGLPDRVVQGGGGAPPLLAPPAGREPAPPDTLTMDQLTEVVLEANPRVQAARQRAEAAEARIPQAGALPDPQLSAGLMSVPVPDFGLSTEGMTMFSFQVSQRIPTPGSRDLREEAARQAHQAALLEVEELERQVVAELKEAYHELLFTYEAEEILRRNRDLVEDLAHVAGRRLAVAEAPQQDVLRAHTEVSRLDDQIVAVGSRRTEARTRIDELMDREATLEFVPAEPEEIRVLARRRAHEAAFTAAALETGMGGGFPDLSQLQARALEERPALLGQEARMGEARSLRDLAERQRRPDLGWMASYSPRVGRQDMVSFGVMVDLPLFRGRKQDQALVEAQAQAGEERAVYDERAAEVRAQVAERYDGLLRLRERLDLLESGVIPQAEATVESAVGAYQTGVMEFAGLLEAQAELFRNEVERARLLAEFGSALAGLEAAVGSEIEYEVDR